MRPEVLESRSESERRPSPGPVFIGGLARSGKTLVRRSLSAHTQVAFSRRTNLWTEHYGRYGDLSDPSNFERCVAAVLRRKQVASLQPDLEGLRREFAAGPCTYGRLFELLHEQHSARTGRARWGDQTALVELFTDELMAAYPGARVIHLLRDPRDRYAAARAKYGERATSLGGTTARWMLSASCAQRCGQAYPDAYRVVRYETLVTAPEQTLRELCEFIGESYGPSTALAGSRSSLPITDRHVGEYRHAISPADRAFIERFAGHRMADHGYERDRVRQSHRERLRSAPTRWPLGLAGYGAQRIRDAITFHARARQGGSAR